MKTVSSDINNDFKSKYDVFITGAFFLVPGFYWLYVVFEYGTV